MIAGVVLAAGGSTRLGRPKPCLEIDGRTLVRHAATCALEAGCRPVIVVLGSSASDVGRAVEALAVRAVINERWADGIGASIRTGIDSIERERPVPDAVVLLACDQPLLQSEVVRHLCEAWNGAPDGMVASAYGGTVGIPALFGADWYAALRGLTGDRGAKILLNDNPGRLVTVPWPDGTADVDTPEDYERHVRGRLGDS